MANFRSRNLSNLELENETHTICETEMVKWLKYGARKARMEKELKVCNKRECEQMSG